MKKKFDCKNCSKQFEADDQGVVTCPYCHCDNVEPARFHLPSWIGRIGLIMALILTIAGAWWLLGPTGSIAPIQPGPIPPGPGPIPPDTDTINLAIPPTVEITEPEFDGKYYTVTVKAKNVQKGIKFYYVRMNHFGDKKVLQKSDDGHFSNIPYNEESGNSYDFAIMDASNDTLLCDPEPVTGFVNQITVDESKKMTIEQLQLLIDNNDESLLGVGENDYLAPDYKFIFEGNVDDKPQSFLGIKEKLIFEIWSKVTVTKIGYDERNRINSITLKVVANNY